MNRKQWRRRLRAALDEVEKDPEILTDTMADDMVRAAMPSDVLELLDDWCDALAVVDPEVDNRVVLAMGLRELGPKVEAFLDAMEEEGTGHGPIYEA